MFTQDMLSNEYATTPMPQEQLELNPDLPAYWVDDRFTCYAASLNPGRLALAINKSGMGPEIFGTNKNLHFG